MILKSEGTSRFAKSMSESTQRNERLNTRVKDSQESGQQLNQLSIQHPYPPHPRREPGPFPSQRMIRHQECRWPRHLEHDGPQSLTSGRHESSPDTGVATQKLAVWRVQRGPNDADRERAKAPWDCSAPSGTARRNGRNDNNGCTYTGYPSVGPPSASKDGGGKQQRNRTLSGTHKYKYHID